MVDGTERISEIIARAGGATQSARWSHTRITRGDESIKRNLGKVLSSATTLTELGLEPGDVIYIPAKNPLMDWRNWTTIVSGAYITLSLIDRIQNK
jgi:protein involved in polysaccharide export with SLBB domain